MSISMAQLRFKTFLTVRYLDLVMP